MGFSQQCAIENQFCAPVPDAEGFRKRIELASQFWQSFKANPNPFAQLQPVQLDRYRSTLASHFGGNQPIQQSQYFDVNKDQFPPRGLVEFQVEGQLILLTTGMSLVPQPNVEVAVPNPAKHRRVELGFQIPLAKLEEGKLQRAREMVAAVASIPWKHFSWLGEGHTCSFPGVLAGVEDVRLQKRSELNFDFAPFRNDPVNVLWLVPQV